MTFSAILGLALAVAGTPPAVAAEPAPKIAVIVGKTSFIERVSKDDLHELYMRRRRVWPGGERALPGNLPPGTDARERFSRLILGRSSQDLVSYWNARYFEGITPPPVLPTPAAVRAYVNEEPGAIGYVPADEVGDCRVLLQLE